MSKSQNKKQILLSVLISCRGGKKILEKNLQALSSQDLNPELWEPVFIFHKGVLPPSIIKEHFSKARYLFLPKGFPIYEKRNLGLENIHSPYIYFIDEDVILENSQHLSQLIKQHKKQADVTVIGGAYENHKASSFWGKTYNWIVKLWVQRTGFMPAGNLSLKTSPDFKARFYSPNKSGFGGEEIHFLQSLQKEGHNILYHSDLSVKHLARHSWKDFIQRAWLHGLSLSQQSELAKQASKKNLQGVDSCLSQQSDSFKETSNSNYPLNFKQSVFLFFKEPEGFLVKSTALFYFLILHFRILLYKVFKR